MKQIFFMLALLASVVCPAQTAKSQTPKGMRLVWAEEFNGKTIDTTKWNIATRGGAHWDRYMAPQLHKELIELKGGNLVLIGKTTPEGSSDTSKYVTGGLDSRGKFGFTYGRVEIRAKTQSAQGAWPALWAVGAVGKWPNSGEIDIIEHLNHDDFVYQTFHSYWTYTLNNKTNPIPGGKGAINKDDYNLYALERTPTKVTWFVNGKETFSYAKLDDAQALADGQWPLDHPYFFILSQQLGGPGTWVGEIDNNQLPVRMWIDYIRVYEPK